MDTFEFVLHTFCIMILLKAYGGQGMKCGHLNVMHSHKHIGNVTIKRCGFVGIE